MAPSNEIHVYSYSKIKETTPLNQNVGQQINKNYGKTEISASFTILAQPLEHAELLKSRVK